MFNRIYIHVPFCIRKCPYCAFVSDSFRHDDLIEYPSLLISELQVKATSPNTVDSIYFGGGTPTLLTPQQLELLLDEIARLTVISDSTEISVEANPGTVTAEVLHAYRSIGINRLSLGIQSFDDRFLGIIRRIHTAEQSLQAFFDARKSGFDNISIDLIHSLPGQSMKQWRSELKHAVELRPEHISIYGLTVEEGTPFSHLYPVGSPMLADEDLSADMFEIADDMLAKAGFEHYEIASYALPGCRSRHNSGYWNRDGYLGLGVSAHSFLKDGHGVRFSNPATLEEYRRMAGSGNPLRLDEHKLTLEEAIAEHMFLGLRLSDGINLSAFEREFDRSIESVYGSTVSNLADQGLLQRTDTGFALTLRGMLLSNQVFSRFIYDR